MVMLWEKKGATGQQVDMPAPGYTWRTLPELNKQIWTTYRDVPLQEIRALVKASHKQVQDLVRGYHGEQLFQKKVYKWTGSTSVAAYLISATSSHYDWALKLIKKCLSRK